MRSVSFTEHITVPVKPRCLQMSAVLNRYLQTAVGSNSSIYCRPFVFFSGCCLGGGRTRWPPLQYVSRQRSETQRLLACHANAMLL